MAKVTGPLMSVSATGTLGKTMTFDKRGYVRKWVVPTNPNTAGQQAIRNILKDIQLILKELGAVKRPQVKEALGYRWGSVIISELMASDHAKWDSLLAAEALFQAAEKTAWEGANPGVGITADLGGSFYAVVKAAYDVCLRVSGSGVFTAPVAANAATIGPEFIDDTP